LLRRRHLLHSGRLGGPTARLVTLILTRVRNHRNVNASGERFKGGSYGVGAALWNTVATYPPRPRIAGAVRTAIWATAVTCAACS
jgi:hypothetical protein